MHVAKIFTPIRSKYIVFTADYILPTLICLAILAIGYFSLYSAYFKISHISCSLDYLDCNDQSILAELDKLKGQNIFTLNSSPLIKRLTSGDYTIREVVMHKELPGSLKFELQSVYPVVALSVVGDQHWIVLDEKYRVIGSRDIDPNVPTVILSGPLTLTFGQPPSDPVILQTLTLATKLATELPSVKTLALENGDTIRLTLASGVQAFLTPKKDIQTQLKALQAVLSDATITTGITSIDVRFARPVLR